ncbi:MAG: tRNA pseudouridine(55) synthase TruB [Tissierellia bacterium]|nr:tRNA pseudouridine(55) synthase TruB [Tissierellia bacterium]
MLNGFLLIDKEENMTSYDVIRKIKRLLKEHSIQTKIGHTGTLDPFATGLLIVLFGKYTRLSDYFMQLSKRYEGEFVQGFTTDTGDYTGKVVEAFPLISQDKIKEKTHLFLGKSLQIPPAYSAVKHNGKKLYEYARKGIVITKAPREIEVFDFNVSLSDQERYSFSMCVSSGTYVRTVIEDYMKSLGGGAYISSLRRTSSGNLHSEDALSISKLDSSTMMSRIQKISDDILPYPVVEITDVERQSLIHGIQIKNNGNPEEAIWLKHNNEYFALAKRHNNQLFTKLFLVEV